MFSGLLQDWTTISGSGTSTIVQSAQDWADLSDYSNVTFWIEVKDLTSDSGVVVSLTYQTAPTQDEPFFLPIGTVVLTASPNPVVTKVRLADNLGVSLARFVRWSITPASSTNWSVTFRIFAVATNGLEGPRGAAGDSSGFRLTLTSGTPVTTSDVTSASTIYLTPYMHSNIVLYDGTNWNNYTSGEISMSSSSLVSNSVFDIFAYYDTPSSTVKLEASHEWSTSTTRFDAVARQDGILVKTSDPTRRLVGTILMDGIHNFTDSGAARLVWNANNRVDRFLSVVEATASWTYATASYRAAHNSTANSFQVVLGDVGPLHANVYAICEGNASGLISTVGIGIDSTTVNSAQFFGKTTEIANVGSDSTHAEYRGYLAIGAHTITWLEYAQTTVTFFSKNGSPAWATSGMNGTVSA